MADAFNRAWSITKEEPKSPWEKDGFHDACEVCGEPSEEMMAFDERVWNDPDADIGMGHAETPVCSMDCAMKLAHKMKNPDMEALGERPALGLTDEESRSYGAYSDELDSIRNPEIPTEQIDSMLRAIGYKGGMDHFHHPDDAIGAIMSRLEAHNDRPHRNDQFGARRHVGDGE